MSHTSPTPSVLTGQVDTHLCTVAEGDALGARVHRDVRSPFRQLQDAAGEAGFDLRILSGFRSFEEQRSIWNRKATGQRAVLDSDAVPLDIARLRPDELILAILRWSALPGASRHHWGTDLDVYDQAATPDGYEIELIPDEVNPGGMFGPLHAWLDDRMAAGSAFGFFRPYDSDRGGVAPERWHLSYAPVATAYLQHLTVPVLRDAVATGGLELADIVIAHLETIHRRFVINVNPHGSFA